jgi:hypothetical protein
MSKVTFTRQRENFYFSKLHVFRENGKYFLYGRRKSLPQWQLCSGYSLVINGKEKIEPRYGEWCASSTMLNKYLIWVNGETARKNVVSSSKKRWSKRRGKS